MTFKTELKYECSFLRDFHEGKLEHTEYKYRLGCLDAFAVVFDYINNKDDRNLKEVLTFITDNMTIRGAYKMKLDIIDTKSK
tara:strand:+ start:133 stop:378 length:246 start_codon:yes stop_codon:yes gene_type:complete